MRFLFKRYNLVKIPGKSSFEDITTREVGLMIEADSSISENGNEYFSSRALDEFLHGSTLKRPDLINIREQILKDIYIDVPESKTKNINTEFLKLFARDLRISGEE
jgi:hypothetical protein